MYHSYLASRLLSVAHTLVQRSNTLVQRPKHACAAFQNACSALHTRLFSVANPLVQRYESLVQRCRRLYSAPLLHSFLTEGSAAWAVALNIYIIKLYICRSYEYLFRIFIYIHIHQNPTKPNQPHQHAEKKNV